MCADTLGVDKTTIWVVSKYVTCLAESLGQQGLRRGLCSWLQAKPSPQEPFANGKLRMLPSRLSSPNLIQGILSANMDPLP